jgi:PAS domain S-box-containing protein
MSKPSILVVDDESTNLKVAAECLIQEYVVHLTRSGQEALAILEKKRVDVILLDIRMPEMDGFQTCERIKKLTGKENIPIIFLTSDDSQATISKAFEMGAVDYILKPFKVLELLARVRNRVETEMLKVRQARLIQELTVQSEIIKKNVAYIKTDALGIIMEASPSFCKLFEHPSDSGLECNELLIGKNIKILKSNHTSPEVYKVLWETISSGETFTHEIEDRKFNGETHWYKVTIASLQDDFGEIESYTAFYQDIEEKKNLENQLSQDF